MTIADIIATVGYVLADIPIPPPDGNGSQRICTMQGFFEQIGLGAILLNAALSLNYLFVLKLEWSTEYIKKLEPYGFGFIFVVTFVCAILPIPLNLYNNAIIWCWIADPVCEDEGTCDNSVKAFNFQLYLFYIPLWICIVFSTTVMCFVISVVYHQDRAVRKMVESDRKKFETTKRIIIQALLYVGAFFFTYIFVTILRIQVYVTGQSGVYTTYLAVFFVPLQGLFNLAGFIFPRAINARMRMREASLHIQILYVFFFIEASTVQNNIRKRMRRNSPPSQTHGPEDLEPNIPESETSGLSQLQAYDSEEVNSSFHGDNSPVGKQKSLNDDVHEIELDQL